jgi:hypothetical protein
MPVELHLVGMTDDFKIWHTIRDGGGNWAPFGNVIAQALGIDPAKIEDVACAVDPKGNLHVVLVANDGQLLHSMRKADREWTSIADVWTHQSHDPQQGKFTAVAATTEGSSLHVVVAKDDQKLYYTRRDVTGGWSPKLTAFAPADPPSQPPLASRRFKLLSATFVKR